MNDRETVVRRFLTDRTTTHRDEVITTYRYLCRRGAQKFRRPESDVADLEQVAAIGLIKATDTYRAERTTPFEAYAWMLVVGELMHYVRDHERAVRVPRTLRSLERRYLRAWEVIAARESAEPSLDDLARELGVPVRVIGELQNMRRGNRLAGTDPESSRTQLQCDALAAPGPTLSLEERLTVILAVEDLSVRERIVVLGTFAAGLSQSEIARTLGLSQSQVSKILGRALSKLHQRVA